MKKLFVFFLVMCILLSGCTVSEKYALEYTAPDYYVQTNFVPEAESYFAEHSTNLVSGENQRPVILLGSRAEYEAFSKDLETMQLKAAAECFREQLSEVEDGSYADDDIFSVWSVAVVCCAEPENIRHILQRDTSQAGLLQIQLSRVTVKGDAQTKALWLIPVWITKPTLEGVAEVDAVVVQTVEQRYPLSVISGQSEEGYCLTENVAEKSCDVKIRGLSQVKIDFAGEVMDLREALEQGRMTPEQLLLRARIDAGSGLCEKQEYNDGGSSVFIYENYRLYKIKQFTASGKTVEGDLWITAPEIELNMIK